MVHGEVIKFTDCFCSNSIYRSDQTKINGLFVNFYSVDCYKAEFEYCQAISLDWGTAANRLFNYRHAYVHTTFNGLAPHPQ